MPDIEACPRQPTAIITSAFLPDLDADALEYCPVAVPKPVSTAALLRMVKTVAAGYARPMIRRFARRFDLSGCETEVLAFLAQGLTPKEIARRLSCKEKTVYFHLAGICRKMDCHDYRGCRPSTRVHLGHTPPEHTAHTDTTHRDANGL